MRKQAVTLTATTFFICGQLIASAATFTGLGLLQEGYDQYSFAQGVSNDGRIVVGYHQSGSNTTAVKWQDGSIVNLGLSSPPSNSGAYGISADGQCIVGYLGYGSAQAYLIENDVLNYLGYLVTDGGFSPWSLASGVSYDGSVVVGYSKVTLSRSEAFRWANGEMQGLGFLGSYNQSSYARAVSNAGNVIAGYGTWGYYDEAWQAFAWQNGVMTGLSYLGTGNHSEAHGISGDGSTIVGFSNSQPVKDGYQASYWKDGAVSALGFLQGYYISAAYDASYDGSRIIGMCGRSGDREAFLWDETNGMRSIKAILENDYNLNLTGWDLTEATAISDDGNIIVGRGYNPQGDTEAWIVTIPEPATILLTTIGGLLVRKRYQIFRQRKRNAENKTGSDTFSV